MVCLKSAMARQNCLCRYRQVLGCCGPSKLRVYFHGFVVVGYGTVKIAFFAIGKSAAVVGLGIIRGEFYGLVVVGYGAVKIAFAAIGKSAVVVGINKRWV